MGQTSFCTTFETELIGRLTLASDGEVLTGCWFEHDRNLERGAAGELVRDDALAAFAPARDWLARYFAGEKPALAGLAHRADGTEFQRAVWAELMRVPYGSVTSYGALARALGARLGRLTSARAVGGAVGRNRICVIVPCHRVVAPTAPLRALPAASTSSAGCSSLRAWTSAGCVTFSPAGRHSAAFPP